MAPELVEDDLGGRVALQLDDDAHALAVRFVANVGDALDALVARRLGDLLDEARLADLERNRRQYNRLPVVPAFFDDVRRAHHDRAASSGIGVARAALRSEEHTSELQSLMRISYAVFCLQKKQKQQ